MAFSLNSLAKSLSSLLPSQSLPTIRPRLPPKLPNFAPPVSHRDTNSTSISLSSSSTAADQINAITCPSLAYANTLFFKSGYYNVQIVVNDQNEQEDKLAERFMKTVVRARVLQECKRRMFFESSQEKRKRKLREASKRNRKRRPKPKSKDKEKAPKKKKKGGYESGDDDWGLPEGDLP